MNINPMLAQTGTERDLQDPGKAAEVKLDGTRAWIVRNDEETGIFGRPRDKGVSSDYTDRLVEVRDSIPGISAGSFILDVEIVYFDQAGRSIFEGSQRRCSTESVVKQREYQQLWPVQALAFDIIYLDGKQLHNHTWETRKQLLQDLLKESLQRAIVALPHTIDNKQEFYNKVVARGEEGVIVKGLKGRYEEGRRSPSWLKVKHWNTEKTLVMGYTEGSGKRDGFFGSLILAQPGADGHLKYVGKVGSGFNDAEVRRIYGILKASETDGPLIDARNGAGKLIDYTPVKVSLEIEVRFQETTKRGIFRMPTVLKDDRDQNRIFYNSKTITAKPRPTNLMDMLKELTEKG